MDNSAMFKIGYGLYLLTAKEGQKDNGCIVNTVMQVTQTPLTMVLGLNKMNYTHDMIKKTGVFNVTALCQNCPFDLFKQFGFQSGRDTDKFAGVDYAVRADNGLLYLNKHATAYFSCRVLEEQDYGTHTLFKAEVVDARTLSNEESLTYSYYQTHTKPKPQPVKFTKTVWRCKICGYIYEGEELPADFICPLCKHGAADFEKITVDMAEDDNNKNNND